MSGNDIGIPSGDAREKASRILQIQAQSFSGPLPPPAILAKYNDIIPNGAERIMAMAEKQRAHRERLETLVVESDIASRKRGAVFAFTLCLMAIGGGLFLIHEGRSAEGLSAIITSLAGLVSVFFYSKHEQKKERIEKAAAIEIRKR